MGITLVAVERKRTAKKKQLKEKDATTEKGYIRDLEIWWGIKVSI